MSVEDQARLGVTLYREIFRRLHVVPWGRRDKVFASAIVLFALANLMLNILILVGVR